MTSRRFQPRCDAADWVVVKTVAAELSTLFLIYITFQSVSHSYGKRARPTTCKRVFFERAIFRQNFRLDLNFDLIFITLGVFNQLDMVSNEDFRSLNFQSGDDSEAK